MKTATFLNQTSVQAAAHEVSVIRVRGNYNGTANNQWLMLFDSNGQPAPPNGTAPMIAAIPVYVGAAFFAEFELGSLEFTNGVYAALSSTQESLTLSNQTMDITVEIQHTEEPQGTSFAGDTTTGVDSLVVYASSATTNLFAIRAENNASGIGYLQLFTAPTPSTGQLPHMQWTFSAGQTRQFQFGKQGIHPVDGAVASETMGVYLYGSSTSNSFTATTGSHWNIQAEFGATSKG